ncbi:metacaspase-1-like [Lolium rigidum]|uniref:metacaspase-1-like n=1 Tax=Lolium rigidum TaxID=89674 RepID=UPI001F5D0EFA|nr:metacaspase-1-like [Lolium rigidum]
MECGHCGTRFAVPRGARTVECARCRGVTRVDRHGAVGFVRNMFSNIAGGGRTKPHPGYPRVQGNKRALLVGINYTGTASQLNGPINDVKCMSFLLSIKYAFPSDSILILTDEQVDPYRRPTRSNILVAMRWLVQDCSSGDSLVFHFSGHGNQVEDDDGDELDGQDETICPLDWEQNGQIRDDEINETIVRPLVHGVRLHAIIDACRSGTVLDLPNLCQIKRYGKPQWTDHSPLNGASKNTSGGHAILISGCAENDNSQDGSDDETMVIGALTYSLFAAAWSAHRPLTYGQLLSKTKAIIADCNKDSQSHCNLPAAIAPHVREVVNFSGVQEPQLSSSDKFDINRTTFML